MFDRWQGWVIIACQAKTRQHVSATHAPAAAGADCVCPPPRCTCRAAAATTCSATVWRARCLTNNEIVAVKVLNLEAQMAPLEDIVHEAQTMKVCVVWVCLAASTWLCATWELVHTRSSSSVL